ncbi:hypothetical protein ES707_00359 [subsurface metagenome]
MKEFHIYSQEEGAKVLFTYIKGKGIEEKIVKDGLMEFLITLYNQGLFLGHEGEIIPHLSRKL